MKVGNTVKVTVLPAFLGFLKFKVFEGEYLKMYKRMFLYTGDIYAIIESEQMFAQKTVVK